MNQGWRDRWREVFGLDLRSLALFRFALGSVLAVDMLARFADLRVFYTDWGVMPRDWAQTFGGPLRISIHFANGDAWFAAVLLAAEWLACVAFALGYRTRAAGAIAFVLQGSLLNRNPMILLGGDTLLVCLLFWGMFLPLNARWSIDAALSPHPPPERNAHVSAASAGLILQVLSVYFFSALLKSDPEWWPGGTAVYYTMELERYRSQLGRLLLDFPALMQGLSYFVFFLELLGPLLALSPILQRPLRFAVMACLMSMHLGFIVFMEIGFFPFASLASLTVLLGGWAWDRADRRLDRGHGLRIYYDRDCGFCITSCRLLRTFLVLRRCEILPAQDSARANALMQAQYSWVVIDAYDVAHTKWSAFVALLRHSLLFRWLAPLAGLKIWVGAGDRIYDWVGRHRGAFGRFTAAVLPARPVRFEAAPWTQSVAGAFVVLLLAWNLVTIRALPERVGWAGEIVLRPLRIDQIWNMFAPSPLRDDGWYIIPGTFEDGTELDLRTKSPVTFAKPDDVAGTEPNVRWRTYHTLIWWRYFSDNRKYYARWLCREWNVRAAPGRHLLSLRIVYMLERTVSPTEIAPVEQRVLWRQDCLGKDAEPAESLPEPRLEPIKEGRSRPV